MDRIYFSDRIVVVNDEDSGDEEMTYTCLPNKKVLVENHENDSIKLIELSTTSSSMFDDIDDHIDYEIKVRPSLIRLSGKKCIVCKEMNVCYSSFQKCINCNNGYDAYRDWKEFKINADFKPAHSKVSQILFAIRKMKEQ